MLSKRVVEVASTPLLWRSRLFTVPGHGHAQVHFGLTRVDPLRCMSPFQGVDPRDVNLLLPEGFSVVSLVLSVDIGTYL